MKIIALLILASGLNMAAIAQDTTDQTPIKFKSNYAQVGVWREEMHVEYIKTIFGEAYPNQRFTYNGFQFLFGKSFFLTKHPYIRPYIHVDWIRLGMLWFAAPGFFISPLHLGLGLYIKQAEKRSVAFHFTAGYNLLLGFGLFYHGMLYAPGVKVNYGKFSVFADYRSTRLKEVDFRGSVKSISLGLGLNF